MLSDENDRLTFAAALVPNFSPSAAIARGPGAGLPFRLLKTHDIGRRSTASHTIAIERRPSCRSLACRPSPLGAPHIRRRPAENQPAEPRMKDPTSVRLCLITREEPGDLRKPNIKPSFNRGVLRYAALNIVGLPDVDYRSKTFSCSQCGSQAYLAVIDPIKDGHAGLSPRRNRAAQSPSYSRRSARGSTPQPAAWPLGKRAA